MYGQLGSILVEIDHPVGLGRNLTTWLRHHFMIKIMSLCQAVVDYYYENKWTDLRNRGVLHKLHILPTVT
jgi:hypothetical protein